MDYVVHIILLVLLAILTFAIAQSTTTVSTAPISLNGSLPVTIIDETEICAPALKKYAETWNYTYFEAESPQLITGFVLHVKEVATYMNRNKSLDLLCHIGSNAHYIVFEGCQTYLTNDTTVNWDSIHTDIQNIELAPDTRKIILAEGYPVLTQNGIILHSSYLMNIFQSSPIPFDIPTIIPSIIYPRRDVIQAQPSRIPRLIHQTFQTRLLPHTMGRAAYSWINGNPHYEYNYYDDNDRRAFIQKHFDTKVLTAYDSLIPGAFRADLWRYCVIYIEGGVYIDIKLGPLAPLDRIIPPDVDLLLVNDTNSGMLFNGFFAAVPEHPAILEIINLVVKHILQKDYGSHVLYPTGPLAMGTAILPLYGYTEHAPSGKHVHETDVLQIYSHRNKDGTVYIIDTDATELVRLRYENMVNDATIQRITGLEHYRPLWNKRMIYRD